MKVLYATHHYLSADAGAPGVTLEVAEGMKRRGSDVELLSYDDLPTTWPIPMKSALLPAWVLRRVRERNDALDVIDASTGDSWLVTRTATRPAVVVRSHGLEHSAHLARLRQERAGTLDLSWKYRLYWGGPNLLQVASSIRRADRVLVLNDHDRAFITERFGVAPHRVVLTRNGLADSLLGLPTPEPGESDRIGVAQLGSWIPGKGVHVTQRVLSAALRSHPLLRASLLGVGVGAETVLEHFPDDVKTRVDIVPRYVKADLPALLKGHEIKLFPTLSEAFGLALVEAMACGLVPVAADAHGPRSIIEHGVDGLLVPRDDPRSTAEALEVLLADPQRRLTMRRAAQIKAQRYGWDSVIDQTARTYEAAILDRAVG